MNGYTLTYFAFALLLAGVPFLISSLLLKAKKLPGSVGALLAVFWFFFFPNIPYLFTKGRYLIGYCHSISPWDLCGNSWLIGFFFFHAFIGVPLMYLSLQQMTAFFREKNLAINHWLVAGVMLLFSSLALPIGLYGRFNTWNLLTQPRNLVSSLLSYFSQFGLLETGVWFLIFFAVYALTVLFVRFATQTKFFK